MSRGKTPKSDGYGQLADGFEVLTRSEWEELATAGLRGRPLASLNTTTADGIELIPVHGPDTTDVSSDPAGLPGFGDRTRGSRASGNLLNGWDVRSLVVDKGLEAANAVILDELLRGSTSVLLDPIAIGISTADDLAVVLDSVHLEMTSIAIVPGPQTATVARWLLDIWESAGVEPSERRGVLGIDPIGVAARHGGNPAFDDDALALIDRSRHLERVRPVVVDATPYADAGASDARQLGWATAAGVEVLRALVDHGMTVEEALEQLSFTISADVDQFATVARMRASRRLWARVAEASGASDSYRGQMQHAFTAAADLTRWDPWVNLLRGTVAAFAAGLGGADSVTVRPFDSALGQPNEFGRRIARNTQLLLLEESSLAAVIDPAGGSWYVEHLTDQLAEKAWQHFQQVEADGGIATALASGQIAADSEACWNDRAARLSIRSEAITGVTEFPDLDEQVPERDPGPELPFGPLPLRRRAAAFEALRDATEASGGAAVGLAALGPLVEHGDRMTFAENFFAVAGLRTVSVTADSAVEKPAVVVVCGSDERYANEGVQTVTALRVSGVTRIYLTGQEEMLDTNLVSELRDGGLDDFVHARSDLNALLGQTLADLGVANPQVNSEIAEPGS